jgi:hypothetical protein
MRVTWRSVHHGCPIVNCTLQTEVDGHLADCRPFVQSAVRCSGDHSREIPVAEFGIVVFWSGVPQQPSAAEVERYAAISEAI